MQHARHNILIRKVACLNDRQKGFVTCVSLITFSGPCVFLPKCSVLLPLLLTREAIRHSRRFLICKETTWLES